MKLVLCEDKLGNDAADALAVAGALLHRSRGFEQRRAHRKLQVAMRVQRMMLDIVKERTVREKAITQDVQTSLEGGSSPTSSSSDIFEKESDSGSCV